MKALQLLMRDRIPELSSGRMCLQDPHALERIVAAPSENPGPEVAAA
jgi:hypothetical protein